MVTKWFKNVSKMVPPWFLPGSPRGGGGYCGDWLDWKLNLVRRKLVGFLKELELNQKWGLISPGASYRGKISQVQKGEKKLKNKLGPLTCLIMKCTHISYIDLKSWMHCL